MENKARYTLVGLFLVVFTSLTVIFVLWLARYDADNLKAQEYRIYSKTSVAGLINKSIVQYKGLDIGVVDEIRINPDNSEQIEIILTIKKPEIIKSDSLAVIESQGVTGNKHIEIIGGSKDAQPLAINEKGYGVIILQKSFFDTLTSQAGSITEKINIVVSKIDLLLKEENMKNFNELLSNSNNSAKNLDKVLIEIEDLINKKVAKSLEHIDKLSSTATKSLYEIDKVTQSVDKVIQSEIKEIIQDLKRTLNSTSNVDKVIEKIDQTLEKVDTTLENFNENGGDMIFTTREIQYGPGEGENK